MKTEIEAGLRTRSRTEAGFVAYPTLTELQPSMGRTAPTAESTPPRQRQDDFVGEAPSVGAKVSSAQQFTTPPRGDRNERDGPKPHVVQELKQRAKAARREMAGRCSGESRRRMAAQPAGEQDLRPRQLVAKAAKRGRRRGPPLPPHPARWPATTSRRSVLKITTDLWRGSATASGNGGTHARRGDELVQDNTPGCSSITAPR